MKHYDTVQHEINKNVKQTNKYENPSWGKLTTHYEKMKSKNINLRLDFHLEQSYWHLHMIYYPHPQHLILHRFVMLVHQSYQVLLPYMEYKLLFLYI